MSIQGNPSHDLQTARRGWVDPVLNAAVAFMLVAPVAVALGWPVIDSILDQL